MPPKLRVTLRSNVVRVTIQIYRTVGCAYQHVGTTKTRHACRRRATFSVAKHQFGTNVRSTLTVEKKGLAEENPESQGDQHVPQEKDTATRVEPYAAYVYLCTF